MTDEMPTDAAAEDGDFSIHQLASEAGVEPRTIRSYVKKGLIPGPESLGRGARYPRAAVDRLKVLQLIRDADRSLTLDQIRMLLHKLAPSELRGLADGRLRISAVLDRAIDPAVQLPRSSAIDYLQQLREKQTAHHHVAFEHRTYAEPPTGGFDDQLPALEEAARALVKLAGLSSASRGVRGEHWYRLPLTPDIDLSIRGSFGSDQIAQLHRIGDALRLLLTKGPRK